MPPRHFRLSKLTCALIAAGLITGTLPIVRAAPASSFQTDEYYASGALDLINAAEAYALGYSGLGQVVGVIDTSVRAEHPELSGKVDLYPLPSPEIWDDTNAHGTHVAGIIAAKKDGQGMHGTAFDASLVTAGMIGLAIGDYDLSDILNYMEQRDVKIFNNSWGWTEYIPLVDEEGNGDLYPVTTALELYPQWDPDVVTIANYAMAHPGSLFVFAAGNSGFTDPGMGPAALPYFYGNDLSNLLSVVSVNPYEIERNADGTLQVNVGGVSEFSNLAGEMALYSVSAPGTHIYSLNSTDLGYIPMYGTSMAAPSVSGAAALVAQAYPWLSGKQIADTILTTANRDFVIEPLISNPDNPSEDLRVALLFADPLGAGTIEEGSLKILLIDYEGNTVHPNDPSQSQQQSDATKLANTIIQRYFAQGVENSFIYNDLAAALIAANQFSIEFVTREEVFGQGILDAGKAVLGPASLDVNRMSADDVYEVAGSKYALETFDTQGYSAVFSNDITQRQWQDYLHHPDYQTNSTSGYNKDALALAGLDAGLIKTGSGLLVLTGTNDYRGPTVVDAGTLAVTPRADGSGGRLTASTVVVEPEATFTGAGTVASLINDGIVIPGFTTASELSAAPQERSAAASTMSADDATTPSVGGTTLTVTGTYQQTEHGTLVIYFDAAGQHTTLKATSARLDGTLNLIPVAPTFYADGQHIALTDVLDISGAISGTFDLVDLPSPTLDFEVTLTNGNVQLSVARPTDAYSRYAQSTGARGAALGLQAASAHAQGDMQTLLSILDYSDSDGRTIARALPQLSAEAYNQAAAASLTLQHDLSERILEREFALLAQPPLTDTWQLWLMPFAGTMEQDASTNALGWDSDYYGLMLGADRRFGRALSAGFHVALAQSDVESNGWGDASSDLESYHLGAQALYAPQAWDGIYLTGQLRLALEHGEMDRQVTIPGYSRNLNSSWHGFTGGALLGAGKDVSWQHGDHSFSLGPVSFLEYSWLSRPEVNETEGQAARLNTDAEYYDSLQLALGAQFSWHAPAQDTMQAQVSLLAAWQHELLAPDLSTMAHFADYGDSGFETATEGPGRDSLLMRGSLRLTHASGFFAEVALGGQCLRADYSSFNASVQAGFVF